MISALKSSLRRTIRSLGYEIYNTRNPGIWSEDGLSTYHNFSFAKEPDFGLAYQRGIEANGGKDHHMRWRAHVALWVAYQAAALKGDFVECGVSTGFLASAILKHLDLEQINKRFFLFDTWSGLDPKYMTEAELAANRLDWYADASFERAERNFSEFKNVCLVRGSVPETLPQATTDEVSYVSLDMNCVIPEIAAAEFFWPKLVSGGFMLLDDYAYSGYEDQHVAFDSFASKVGTKILSLPTGQGIIMKRPKR
jgi:macrocin-O-methyltransferase TylF-like protien